MVKKIKSTLAASVKSKKLNVFVLFLLVAAIVLLLSKLAETKTKTFAFFIEVNNMPKEYINRNKDSIRLNITLKSQGFKLLKYYLNPPKVTLDFNKQTKINDSTYFWERNKGFESLYGQFQQGEEILSITPDTLFFTYDVNAVKKLPVILRSDIHFMQGFDLSTPLAVVPDSIKVIGPSKRLSELKAINTDTLRLVQVNKNISEKVSLAIPSVLQKENISHTEITVTAKVEKFTEGTMQVPITVSNIPDGFQIKTFPKEVTVTYYTSLSNFNSIRTEDFKVVCNFAKVTKQQPYLVPELTEKPKFVKNVKINLNRVEFIQSE